MRRKPPEFDFEKESASELATIQAKIGQEVPLSARYALGPRAILVSVSDGLATLQFPNGAVLVRVPLRDLVDDSSYWGR